MKKFFLLLLLLVTFGCFTALTACTPIPMQDSSTQSSTADSSSVEEKPLSSDASFTVTHIFDCEVITNSVYLSETQLNQLIQAESVNEFVSANVANGATLEVEFNKTDKTLNFTCTSEDGTKQKTANVSVFVKRMFGAHSVQGTGSPANGSYNYDHNGYYIKGMVSAYSEQGKVLSNYYVYEFSATLTGLSKGSELVISSYQTENHLIRFVLRGTSDSSYLLFTDYRENSGFLNYLELKTDVAYTEGESINFKVIHAGNSMVMIHEGETLFRRTLASMTHSELVLNCVEHPFIVNDIKTLTKKEDVLLAYQNALIDYEDPFFGDNSIGFGSNTDQAVKNEDGSIYIAGANSNNRIMGGYYQEGVPVGGHEYAVSVTVRMQNTKESGGAASKSEFQVYKDSKNSVKFHMFRYPTNNTLMAYETKNGEQTDIEINKGNFPIGTDYTYNLLILYKLGQVELWLKDNFETNSSSIYQDYTLVYQNYFDWNHCGFAFAMRQYADTTWSDWNVYYNQDFYNVYYSLHKNPAETSISFSDSKENFIQSSVFTKDETSTFSKDSYYYEKAFLAENGTVLKGNKWMVSSLVNFKDYKAWGQGEFQFYQDDFNAVRYVFEYDGNNFQVFTEQKHNNSTWNNWKIVRRPTNSTPAHWKMTVINDEGNLYLLINGKVWHEYKDTAFNSLYAVFGGKDASLKIRDIAITTDAEVIDECVKNMEYYVYESSYEGRIKELVAEYAYAEKGGIVLAGSSSVDFWNTWQEDLGKDVLAYNMGIGGTTTYDWQVAYDRLIKAMNPSQILLFLGGNDVNGLGETGEATALRLQQMLELMHADFPNANIVYVLSMPVPNNYSNGKFTIEYGRLVQAMKSYGEQNTSWLKTVDLEQYLTVNGVPVAEYFKSDNIHLTEEGYKVWIEQIKPLLVHENTVLKDTSNDVVGGAWSVVTDENGNKTYTPLKDNSFINFNEVQLENNAFIEFDMNILATGSSIAGVMFGLDSPTSNSGFCIGFAANGNPSSAWITNGTANGYGSGDTVIIKIDYEIGKTYSIRIECDIEAGVYNMYINGEFARKLYFQAKASDPDKATLHTGPYFGLYGGNKGGRIEFTNITVGVVEPPEEPEIPEELPYNVIGGEWEVTENEKGNKVYTSVADKSYLVFKDILLENNAVVEFDITILVSSSYTAGALFGLTSITSTDGLCVGRASSGNPGSGWMQNGVQGTLGGGETTYIKMPDLNVVYHIRIECDIEAGVYNMYINGEFARKLYFVENTTDKKTANDSLFKGQYFGLYGGENGRTRFENITISVANPDVPEIPEEASYNVLAGAWEVTEDENGVKSYTSTEDKSYLVFKNILLENNTVIEFDLKILQSSSYTAGVLFGLASDTSTEGLCVGRVNNGKPGSAWIQNGVQGTYGEGDDTFVTMTELNKVYKIKIVCDIAKGTYDLYVDGVFARHLYFVADLSDSKTANDSLHTGAYFGLYGGATGRTQFSNIVITIANDSAVE